MRSCVRFLPCRGFNYGAFAALLGISVASLYIGRTYLRRKWQQQTAQSLQDLADSCLVDCLIGQSVGGWLDQEDEQSESGDREQDWDDCTEPILGAQELWALWS